MKPYQGKIVRYRWRPGQVRGGQIDAAAMVTSVNSDGSVDLTVYPAKDRDPLYLQKIVRMDETIVSHCWHPTPEDERLADLEARVLDLEARLELVSPTLTPKDDGPGPDPYKAPEPEQSSAEPAPTDPVLSHDATPPQSGWSSADTTA